MVVSLHVSVYQCILSTHSTLKFTIAQYACTTPREAPLKVSEGILLPVVMGTHNRVAMELLQQCAFTQQEAREGLIDQEDKEAFVCLSSVF